MGVHNRRTDYLEFRRKRLGLDNLYEDYFQDAMDYFREEFDNPVSDTNLSQIMQGFLCHEKYILKWAHILRDIFLCLLDGAFFKKTGIK